MSSLISYVMLVDFHLTFFWSSGVAWPQWQVYPIKLASLLTTNNSLTTSTLGRMQQLFYKARSALLQLFLFWGAPEGFILHSLSTNVSVCHQKKGGWFVVSLFSCVKGWEASQGSDSDLFQNLLFQTNRNKEAIMT